MAPMLLGGDKTALKDIGIGSISEAIDLEVKELKTLGKDIFIRANRSK
jgi:riboflavin biosynthesis pyrimidine reductase